MKGKSIFDVVLVNEKTKPTVDESAADFEHAISHTGFGKFNVLLFFVAIPVVLSVQFESGTLSYVFPAAQCDLNLTAEKKGVVNASSYIGMLISCLLWGSFIDLYGRKRILIISLFLESSIAFLTLFYTNYAMLITAKLLGGFIIIGASTAFKAFLTEFHGKRYRSRVPLVEGILYAMGNIYMPLLAWLLLPLDITFTISNLQFHSWNIFLFVAAAPALISGFLIMTLLPETPKFLMTQGKNEAALTVFRKIFSLNTGKPRSLFPVTKLIQEKNVQREKKTFIKSWITLFTSKLKFHVLIVCTLQGLLTLNYSSLHSWLPHIYQSMNDFEMYHNKSASFCKMITFENLVNTSSTYCSVNMDNSSVYINALIVGATTISGYLTASTLINILGKKPLLYILGCLSSTCSCLLYVAPNRITSLALICAYMMASGVSIDTIHSIIIDLFPTTLRASAISISMLTSRCFAIVGNLVFPVLLQSGCGPTFFTIGGVMVIWTFLVFLLPNTDMKSLE